MMYGTIEDLMNGLKLLARYCNIEVPPSIYVGRNDRYVIIDVDQKIKGMDASILESLKWKERYINEWAFAVD